jgi:hypothetical protein
MSPLVKQTCHEEEKMAQKTNLKSLVVMGVLLVAGLPESVSGQKYSGGTGEPNDPYRIATPNDLNDIGNHPEDWGSYFVMVNDINLAEYTGTQFNIIGYYLDEYSNNPFTGLFDGNGHCISNFTYDYEGADYVGLFGYVSVPNAQIKGITLAEPNVDTASGRNVGALVGYLASGEIADCFIDGGTVTGADRVGGLVGLNHDGRIHRCDANVDVRSDGYWVGGLIGSNSGEVRDSCSSGTARKYITGGGDGIGGLVGYNSGEIGRSHSASDVSGYMRIGGLVGYNRSEGSVVDSYAEGIVSALTCDVGGLIGHNEGTVSHCYASGTVSGNWYRVGGLIGKQLGRVVSDSNATGNVIGGDTAGGLIGESAGRLSNCFASGSVSGGYVIGGLVGRNRAGGVITNCYAVGGCSGGNDYVGGLVGLSSDSCLVDGCYATGIVSGIKYVGGLVGENIEQAEVRQCYAAGNVTGNINIGGLLGACDDANYVSDCFWDTNTTGQPNSPAGTGKTTSQMEDPNTFMDASWDFVGESDNGPSDLWAMPAAGGYPIFWWQLPEQPSLPSFAGGSGTPAAPYLVSTASQLNSIGCNPRLMKSHFRVISDISLFGVDFWIIGSRAHRFEGGLDGSGYLVSSLALNKPQTNDVGFFGVLGYDAEIVNLMLTDVNVTGYDYVGGLAGQNYSDNVNACCSSGNVYGHSCIGGLFGVNRGDLERLFSSANVTAEYSYAGGLAGRNYYGRIEQCYADGFVSAYHCAGGLLGINYDATVLHSYSLSAVSGGEHIGGVVGCQYDSSVSRSYAAGTVAGTGSGGLIGYVHGSGGASLSFWDVNSTGQATSDGGGTGLPTSQMQTKSTFTDAGWDFVGETANGNDDIWTIHQTVDYPKHVWSLVNFVGWYEVDFLDYAFLANYWQNTNCGDANDCDGTDLDFSDNVDWADLKIFFDNWLAGLNS